VAGGNNTGNGTMSAITTDNTKTMSEDWTVTYDGANNNWKVQGSHSGLQTGRATTGAQYTSDKGEVKFAILAGGVAFANSDKFTFKTRRVRENEIAKETDQTKFEKPIDTH
jgi:hypothetical protein